jgi:hypothetical protein
MDKQHYIILNLGALTLKTSASVGVTLRSW